MVEHTGELRAHCSSGLTFASDQDRLVESCNRAGTRPLSASSAWISQESKTGPAMSLTASTSQLGHGLHTRYMGLGRWLRW